VSRRAAQRVHDLVRHVHVSAQEYRHFQDVRVHPFPETCPTLETDIGSSITFSEMHDRLRLREALAAALAAAQEAQAPDRVLALLQGAYRTLESARFADEDMIRWAEAGLGAWQRWWASHVRAARREHRLLVVDATEELAQALRVVGPDLGVSRVDAVGSRTAMLEALATQPPTAVVFDLDTPRLAPTVELLEWLATDFDRVRRIGFARTADGFLPLRERGLYHALLPKPPTRALLGTALGGEDDDEDWSAPGTDATAVTKQRSEP
jgi:hypothetical protein